jgi:hypothetical protein
MQHSHEVAPGETVTAVLTCAWQAGHTQAEGMLPKPPGAPPWSTITTVPPPPCICGPP